MGKELQEQLTALHLLQEGAAGGRGSRETFLCLSIPLGEVLATSRE